MYTYIHTSTWRDKKIGREEKRQTFKQIDRERNSKISRVRGGGESSIGVNSHVHEKDSAGGGNIYKARVKEQENKRENISWK